MRFVCGKKNCPGLSASGVACAKCGLALTLGGMCRYASGLWRSSLNRFKRRVSIACPSCGKLVPPFRSECKGCGTALTVEGLIEKSLEPHRGRMQNLLTPTRRKKRLFQWLYLAGSASAFWICLGLLEKHFAEGWVSHAMLSIVYLAVFLLVSLWIIPQKTFIVIAQRASKIIKLGLVFNYLTALFLLQMFMGTWQTRSAMLGVLFISSYAGAYVFWRLLWPASAQVADIFIPEARFDPRAPQGRTVKMD